MSQEAEPTALVVLPGSQVTQSERLSWLATVAAASKRKRPTGHDAQDDEPVLEAYVPATQMVQVDAAVAPESLANLPTAHAVQDLAPSNSVYLPAGQGVHEDALSEGKDPATQDAVGTQPLNE